MRTIIKSLLSSLCQKEEYIYPSLAKRGDFRSFSRYRIKSGMTAKRHFIERAGRIL
jgi:hypothetical protein